MSSSTATAGGVSRAVLGSYCALSGLFFSACAFAQLNDPDPWLWVVDYFGAGAVLNVFVWLRRGGSEEEVACVGGGIKGINRLVLATNFVVAGNAVAIVWFLVTLMPQVDLSASPRAVAWSILEYEEGREAAGLALLLAHVWRLRGYLLERPAEKSLGAPVQEGGGRFVGVLGTAVLACALVGGIYLWVYYHPEMNARYKIEHCEGQFQERSEL